MEENIENLVDEEVKKNHHDKKEHKKKYNVEIEKLTNEKNMLNDKLLRVTAEMQNMKRRYDEEISRIYRYDGEELIKKLLNTLDNFERAINMDDNNLDDEVSKFLSGFKLIYNDLKSNLESLEVKEIDALNKEFDPNIMEAVMTEHVEGINPGIVTSVMRKGYLYKDKCIRTAMVKVSE